MCEDATLRNVHELIPCSIEIDEEMYGMNLTSSKGRIMVREKWNRLPKGMNFDLYGGIVSLQGYALGKN